MKKNLFLCVLFLLMGITGKAQMTFTLDGLTYNDVAETDSKGFTTVTVPAGTDLSGLITGVKVDGTTVTISD